MHMAGPALYYMKLDAYELKLPRKRLDMDKARRPRLEAYNLLRPSLAGVGFVNVCIIFRFRSGAGVRAWYARKRSCMCCTTSSLLQQLLTWMWRETPTIVISAVSNLCNTM